MKKITLLLLTFILLVSCSTKKNTLKLNNKHFSINKDSLSIITPYIEIKEKSNYSYIEHPYQRKNLTAFTIQTLMSEFPNAEYIEIPFLFKDYGTINSSLERGVSYKAEKAPIELLTNKYKNSIFVSINGYFGDINRGFMSLFVIDNKNKKWKMIKSYEYDNSPLEIEKLKEIILKSLEKLK
ncbi:hypothetical protein [Winogradskyella vidalii]|uniref:hypothetical protein n=1 Tax=Winogradskyella vidalii TaxID=2615024 RepID=UPI0015CDFD87|nr:hypothetical protein [Winogradskyella vidalii]